MYSKLKLLFIVLIGSLWLVSPILAGEVNLAWDPPDISTDVTGYKIYYGLGSGQYTSTKDVGLVLSAKVENLAVSMPWYFAATAYNAVGYESVYSNEVSITLAPPIITPNSPKNIRLSFGAGVISIPFIICDPQTGVTSYKLTGPSWVPTTIAALADGSLRFDVFGAVAGSSTITVMACSVDNCSTPVSFRLSALSGSTYNSTHKALTMKREWWIDGVPAIPILK